MTANKSLKRITRDETCTAEPNELVTPIPFTMNILSLAPLTVLPASPLEQIDAAHAAGFDAVGLRLQPVMPTDIEVMGNAALLRDIERRLDATGMKVLDIEVFRVGPRTARIFPWRSARTLSPAARGICFSRAPLAGADV